MMRKFISALLLLFLTCGVVSAQEEQSPYEIALERIEEARVSNSFNLNLRSLGLTEVPPEIGTLTRLYSLSLDDNQLSTLPPEIGNLGSLRELYLYDNQLTSLPPEIGNLSNLRDFYLYENNLGTLPSEIGKLQNLVVLNLANNHLTSLPPEIGNLSQLCYLNLSTNDLRYIPSSLGQLSNILECYAYTDYFGIYLDNNPLISPPPEVVSQGTGAILEYLRNEAWWHLQRLIAGGATFTGILAASILGLRWKNRRRKGKMKNEGMV